MIALLILQAVQVTDLPSLLVSGGVAGLVLLFWRQDRGDRAKEKEADAERYEALATDFRCIVESNTVAMTRLTDALANRTVQCPFVHPALVGQATRALAEAGLGGMGPSGGLRVGG